MWSDQLLVRLAETYLVLFDQSMQTDVLNYWESTLTLRQIWIFYPKGKSMLQMNPTLYSSNQAIDLEWVDLYAN